MHTRDPVTSAPPPISPNEQARILSNQNATKALIGHQGVIPQGEFSLAESAEEITFHMAHHVEKKLHAERKVRAEHPSSELTIEAVLLYLEKIGEDDAQAKLEELAANILSGQSDPRSEIAKFSQNGVHQYLALNYALHRGRQTQTSELLLDEIADARAELEESVGSAARAELNTIEAATAYAHDATEINNFQYVYRDVVLGEALLTRTLSTALERFGGKRIAEGLQAIIQALGLDLSAARPSVSKDRIHAILKDMYHLEVAVTVLDGCRELGMRLTKNVQMSFDAESLMQSVVNLIDNKWFSASGFTAMATAQGVQSTTDRVAFMVGVRSVLKDLPVQVFADEETRANVLEASQFALDAAIDEEQS